MSKVYAQLSANVAGAVRNDRIGSEEYQVVPMVMIVEGVLPGSQGPLFYPAEELQKFPAVWNHKPVVIYHPELNGQPLSACDPDILTVQGVGIIMNSKFEDGKLKAEAWVKATRLEEVDDRVSKAITKNETMELSTGLYLDVDPVEGEFGGKKYQGIARNYKPDHLAILPDKIGACSVADGAGFLRANQGDLPDTAYLYVKGDSRYCQVRDSEGQLNRNMIQTALNQISDIDGLSDARKAAMLAKARQLLRKTKEAVTNASTELSFDSIREMLRSLKPEDSWIVDAFPSSFVYEYQAGGMFQQEYEIKEGQAQKIGTPVRVVRHFEYMAANQRLVSHIQYEELTMNKDQMIAHLLKSGKWSEGDKGILANMSEEALKHLVTKADAEKATPAPEAGKPSATQDAHDDAAKPAVANAAAPTPAKPVSVEEYVAAAPAGIREVLSHGIRANAANRAKLVESIKANKKNPFSDEQLQAKSLEDLEAIAALAATDAPVNYAGMGEVAGNASKEEALPLPTMNFSK